MPKSLALLYKRCISIQYRKQIKYAHIFSHNYEHIFFCLSHAHQLSLVGRTPKSRLYRLR